MSASAPVSAGLGTDASALDAWIATQVVLGERQARDRGWWDRMAGSYWPDSLVRLSWHKGTGEAFAAGSRAIAERGEELATHQMGAPAVQVRGDRAFVEAPATMRMVVTIDGVSCMLTVALRLAYRLERRDGEWRILALDAIYESAGLAPTAPGETLSISPEDLTGFRPSYALLALHISRKGIPAPQDELGDDRPEQVAALYTEIWEWMNA